MQTRKEVLEYGLSFPNAYQDAPFHDSNWILIRIRRMRKLFCGHMKETGKFLMIMEGFVEWEK